MKLLVALYVGISGFLAVAVLAGMFGLAVLAVILYAADVIHRAW